MNEHDDCLLTLVLPASLEEEMLDQLAAHPEWVPGFSVTAAEGVGKGARFGSSMERVRGRARRRLIHILMRREDAALLIETLKKAFPSPEVAWWMTAAEGFGRLG